jgi:hypothetical protein
MTAPTIAEYLKYAKLQMAAEAFLKDKVINPETNVEVVRERYSGEPLKEALIDGNKHASRFTETQAQDFADHWKVLDQRPNTDSGFSGTLFECTVADPVTGAKEGELVISFRSTEFIDDAVNDCQVTNKTIFDFGWGFGQIADMEAWYAGLKVDGIPLSEKQFSVTGYSLGAHLATAFNILRQEEEKASVIESTYTFNGAGVGTKTGKLADILDVFNARKIAESNKDLFASDVITLNLYQNLVDRQIDHLQDNEANANDMNGDSNDGKPWLISWDDWGIASLNKTDQSNSEAKLLYEAVNYAYEAQQEYYRIKGFKGGSSEPLKQPTAMAKIEGLSIDYWLAVLKAAENTNSTNTLALGLDAKGRDRDGDDLLYAGNGKDKLYVYGGDARNDGSYRKAA